METIEIRSVLVATDLGESADRLLRTASSIAALTGAELHVTHVHLLPDTPHPAGTPEAETVAQGVAEAEALLDDAVRRGVPAGYEPTSRVVLARRLVREGVLEVVAPPSLDGKDSIPPESIREGRIAVALIQPSQCLQGVQHLALHHR